MSYQTNYEVMFLFRINFFCFTLIAFVRDSRGKLFRQMIIASDLSRYTHDLLLELLIFISFQLYLNFKSFHVSGLHENGSRPRSK